MKIALMVHRFFPDYGGSEITAEMLATGFSREYGDEVTVVTHTQAPAEVDEAFGFRVVREPSSKALERIIRDSDVVFHNNPCLQFYGPQWRIRRPWVVALRARMAAPTGQETSARRVKDALKRRLVDRADLIIANGTETAQEVDHVAAIVPNGYRSDIFGVTEAGPRDRRRIVFVGRLVEMKGVDVLIRAVAALVAKGLDPQLTVVGSGHRELQLRELTAQLGVAERVHFAGRLEAEETARVLNRSAIVVLPSRGTETFGNVLLEGAACGCVPVGSRIGGVPFAVGSAGVLVEPESVDSLEGALERLMTDDAWYESHRARLAGHVARFTPESMVHRYRAMLEAAVQAHRRRPTWRQRLPLPSRLPAATATTVMRQTATEQVALVILARNPTASRTGRIAVLETLVDGLRAEGIRVVVAAVTGLEGPDEWRGVPVHRIAPPSVPGLAWGAARNLMRGRTLNEAVLYSAHTKARIRQIAMEEGATLTVADGIRAVELAEAPGLPVVAHLDDLLSTRYASQEFARDNDSVLGYFGAELPEAVRPFAEKAARSVLALEARRAERAEVAIARRAAVTALTGEQEASVLADRAGTDVEFLPMAVASREPSDAGLAPARTAVFVGVLHYGPNVAALRYLRDEVLPLLDCDEPFTVDVIGDHSAVDLAEFAGCGMNFLGYVDDLGDALRGHRMFLSPILSGTGVKTKVLDAMSVALPVVATPLGVAGVPLVDGESALVAGNPEDFAARMNRLAHDPELARTMGMRGHDVLVDGFGPDALNAKWAQAMNRVDTGTRVLADAGAAR